MYLKIIISSPVEPSAFLQPLDASTFCGPREAGKRVKLSIINLALLGNGYGAETMRKLVAHPGLKTLLQDLNYDWLGHAP